MRLLFLILLASPASAVPVIPNFQQGVMSATTTTKTKVTEVINSYEYRTGYELTTSGTNVSPALGAVSPMGITTINNTINGISSKWTNLDLSTKPTWNIVNKGEAFSFAETLNAPGLINHTLIDRTTDIESVTETTSTFTQ